MARQIFAARRDAIARIPLRPASDHGLADNEQDTLLKEAVALAAGLPADDGLGMKAFNKALTWRAYEIRSRLRTSPHGVFSGISPATFSATPCLRLGRDHQTVTSPEPSWLARLARTLLDQDQGWPQMRLTTSNLTTERGGRYETERPAAEGAPQAVTVSIRMTEVTTFVLGTCRDGVHVEDLLAELNRRWPTATPALGRELLRALIDGGFMLHDLIPDDPRRDPLGHLLNRLPSAAPLRQPLEELRARLTNADRHRPGTQGRGALLAEAAAMARAILPSNRPLRVDARADATVILPVHVADQAAAAAGVLWRIGPGTDPLITYHQRFLTRYGSACAVPLLDMLDPVVGLGPVEGEAGPVGAGNPDPSRDEVLAQLLATAAATGATEVHLDDVTVDRLTGSARGEVPRTAEIYVQVIAAATGSFQLVVSGGSQDALSSSGRFLHLLDGQAQPQPVQETGPLIAELVVRGRSAVLNTVAVETGLASVRIPVGVAAKPGDLDLADLVVFSDGSRLLVWSRRHDRQILPVLYSRIALALLPPTARFLALAGHSGERPWHRWSWGTVTAPFTPAVRYRCTWLALARWVLPRHLATAANAAEWEKALGAWRSATRPQPPDVVITEDADRQLPLDLRRADDRQLLRRYVRRGLTAVSAPPPGTAAVLPGPYGHHLLELIVSLDRTVQAPAKAATVPRVHQHGRGLHFPGGQWLSLVVRAPESCHEEILRSLSRQVEQGVDWSDRWFWLRYHDARHGEHLRIRFHGDPDEVCDRGLPYLSRWALDLSRLRLIGGFSIEPYEQEIERYGGRAAIAAAERFFCTDSQLTLDVLAAVRDADERLVSAATTAAAITRRVGGGAATRRLDRAAHRHAHELRPQARADRSVRPAAWKAALDAFAAALPAAHRGPVTNDLIHLHCNRLVPTGEAIVRALAADLISVQPNERS